MGGKRDPNSILRRVEALSAQGLGAREIATQLGADVQYVHTCRAKLRSWEHYLAVSRKKEERRRRRQGCQPLVDIRAEQERRWKAVEPLLAKGLTYTQVGKRLGMTRNKVAGLKWRMARKEAA